MSKTTNKTAQKPRSLDGLVRRFRSAVSGLWYENPKAAGSVDAVEICGKTLERRDGETSLEWIRRTAEWAEEVYLANANCEPQGSGKDSKMSDEISNGAAAGSTGLFGTWVDASVQKPAAGKKVIICGRYSWSGKIWRTVATWQPAGSLNADFWDDPPDDWWDADGNVCTNPEDMWSEEAIESETSYTLSGVTHWMPLPDAPNAPVNRPL